MRKETKIAVSVIILMMLTLTIVVALIQTYITIPSRGEVTTIGVKAFWDVDCTNEVTEIDWEFVNPDTSKAVIIYIESLSNKGITLTQDTENWNPSNCTDYITLSWDYIGYVLSPDEVIAVEETLSVDSDISGISEFAFDIVITATGI